LKVGILPRSETERQGSESIAAGGENTLLEWYDKAGDKKNTAHALYR
jgi:hypothetical protein